MKKSTRTLLTIFALVILIFLSNIFALAAINHPEIEAFYVAWAILLSFGAIILVITQAIYLDQ